MNYIIIGGTMESKFALDYVASELKKLDTRAEISTYTYGFAMKHKAEINVALDGKTLITHSTGAMVIERGGNPDRVVFISPSQPVPRRILLARAAVKTTVHSWKILTFNKRLHVLRILASNLFELLVHPMRNLAPFIKGEVSGFDLRKVLSDSTMAGEARVIISKRDEMFAPHENIFDELEKHGVELVHLDAMHDEIFIDTKRILKAALKS